MFPLIWQGWLNDLARATRRVRPPRRSYVRLDVERLEDRAVPTITLTPVNIAATPGTAFNGTVATFTDSDPTAVAANFSGAIIWGDSTASPVDGHGVQIVADPITQGKFDIKGTHTYAAGGVFNVAVTVSDTQGNTATTGAMYNQANLVTDNQANLTGDGFAAAAHVDTNLINPWGIAFSPFGPFWISNNNTGLATLYDGTGTTQAAPFTIPGSANPGATSPAPITGTVYNGAAAFNVAGPGTPAQFIYASEDGTISAWYTGASGVLKVDNADFANGPVYKGLAIGSNNSGSFLYATNFRSGTVDVFDTNFQKVAPGTLGFGSFTDPTGDLAGFAPFGIQNLGGRLYVTYAKQNAAKHDDVAGVGNGFVDVFDTSGNFIQRVAAHGTLDSPWGLALAPSSFGTFAGDLLVGNFKGGTINAYDPTTGTFLGQLTDATGKPIVVGGMWGLAFGNNAGAGSANSLFFTAGLNAETHGLFASLSATPGGGGTATVSTSAFAYEPNTKALTITGANFTFSQATTADANGLHTTYTFTIDGQMQSFTDTQLSRVAVNGQGSNASATLFTLNTYTGTDHQTHETAEIAALWQGGGELLKFSAPGNAFVFLQLNGFRNSSAYVGRADLGELFATPGEISALTTNGIYSTIASASQTHFIWGAPTVLGFAANAGDYAIHNDGSGASNYVASGTAFSSMTGTDQGQSFFNKAMNFRFNTGKATHAGDTATFYDSPGNDVFVGNTASSYMYADDIYGQLTEFDQAIGFPIVDAYSFVGGLDTAMNNDPSHNFTLGFGVRR